MIQPQRVSRLWVKLSEASPAPADEPAPHAAGAAGREPPVSSRPGAANPGGSFARLALGCGFTGGVKLARAEVSRAGSDDAVVTGSRPAPASDGAAAPTVQPVAGNGIAFQGRGRLGTDVNRDGVADVIVGAKPGAVSGAAVLLGRRPQPGPGLRAGPGLMAAGAGIRAGRSRFPRRAIAGGQPLAAICTFGGVYVG